MRKKLLIIIPITLLLVCGIVLGVYFIFFNDSEPPLILIRDVMAAETYVGPDGTLPYRIYVPEELSPDQKLPLVLYLHGGGSAAMTTSKNRMSAILYATCSAKKTARHTPALFLYPNVLQIAVG